MKVEIWSDIVCPFCYIGKRRFEAALQEFPHADTVEVVWRSFELTPDYQPVPYVSGLENPTENFFNIVGWLVKHGYSDADILAVTGGNIMRVLAQVW